MDCHGSYDYIRTIGEGAYGSVWLSRKPDGTHVAIKVFKQAHEDAKVRALAKREAMVLQSLSHVNVVRLLDAFKSKTGRVYLVFEYVEYNACAELDRYPFGLPQRCTKLVAWQLLQAVAYLHDNRVVHRDIKPANILLTGVGVVKLCDFGFARFTRCGPRDEQPLSTYLVTRWYRAPEVLVSAVYGPSADVWSLGCTLAELATGRVLFPGKSTADQLWRIQRCVGPLAPRHTARFAADPRLAGVTVPPPHCPLRERLPDVEPLLLAVLEACLRPDPAHRPTVRELLAMPYFAEVPAILPRTPLAGLYGGVPGAMRVQAVPGAGAAGETHSPPPPQQQQQAPPAADGRGNGGGSATSTTAGPSAPVSAAPSVLASEPLSLASVAPTTGSPQQGQQPPAAAAAPSTPAPPAPPAAGAAAAAPNPVRSIGAQGLMPHVASGALDVPRAHGPVAGLPEDGVAVRPVSLGAPALAALGDAGMPLFGQLPGDLPWRLAAACISTDAVYEQGRGGGSAAEDGSNRPHVAVPVPMPGGEQQQRQEEGGGPVVGQQQTDVVRGRAHVLRTGEKSGPVCPTAAGEANGGTGQGGGAEGVASRAVAGGGGSASSAVPPRAAAASEVHAGGGGAGPAVQPTGAAECVTSPASVATGAGLAAQNSGRQGPRLQPAQQLQPNPAAVSCGTGNRSSGTGISISGRLLILPAQSAPSPSSRALGLVAAPQQVAHVWRGGVYQETPGRLSHGSNASAAAGTAVSPLCAAHGAHTQTPAYSVAVGDRGSSRGGSAVSVAQCTSHSGNFLSASWDGGSGGGGVGGGRGCGGGGVGGGRGSGEGRSGLCNTGLTDDCFAATAPSALATACVLTSTDLSWSSTMFSRSSESRSGTHLLQGNAKTAEAMSAVAAAATGVSYGSHISGGSGRQGYRTARERRNGGSRNSDGEGGGAALCTAPLPAQRPMPLVAGRCLLPTIFSATGYVDAPAPRSPGPDSNDSLLARCAPAQPEHPSALPSPQMPPVALPGLNRIAVAAAGDANATSTPPLLPTSFGEPPLWPFSTNSPSTGAEPSSGNFAVVSFFRHHLPPHQPQNPSAASTSAPASFDAPHSGALSNSSLPLADSSSLHNAPPMPSCSGIAPPHRRPVPGEARPLAPSRNGFNSGSLYLPLDRTPAVGGGNRHGPAHILVANQMLYTNLYRPSGSPTPEWRRSGAGGGAGAGSALYARGSGSAGSNGGGSAPTVQRAASSASRTPAPMQHSRIAGTGSEAASSTARSAGTAVSYEGRLLSPRQGQLVGGLSTAVAGGMPPRASEQQQRSGSSNPLQNHNHRQAYRKHQGGLMSLGSSESLAAMVAAGVQLTPADAALSAAMGLAASTSLVASGAAAQGATLWRCSRSAGGDRNQQQQAGAGAGREKEHQGLAIGTPVPGSPVDGASQQQQRAGTEIQALAAAAEQGGSCSSVARGGGGGGGECVPAGRPLSGPRGREAGGGRNGGNGEDGGVEAAVSAREGKDSKRVKGGVSRVWKKVKAFVRGALHR